MVTSGSPPTATAVSTRRPFPVTSNSSISVPLIKGLTVAPGSNPKGAPSKQALEEALVQLESVELIQRVWRTRRSTGGQCMTVANTGSKKRNAKSSSSARPKKKAKAITKAASLGSVLATTKTTEHWIWRSLRSYGVHERVAVIQMISATLRHLDSSTDISSMKESDAHVNFRLARCLIRYMQRHMVEVSNENHRGNRNDRLAIEWTAVLRYLLLRKPVTGGHLALPYLYWPWLCRSIWTMAVTAHRSPLSGGTNKAVAALARLCHELAVHGTVETEAEESSALKQVQQMNTACLWNSKHACMPEDGNMLSPLACLIGAYYMTADVTLKRLIQCSSSCSVSVVNRQKQSRNSKTSSSSAAAAPSESNALERARLEELESVLERCREHAVMEAFESHLAVAAQNSNSNDSDEQANKDAENDEENPLIRSQDDDDDEDGCYDQDKDHDDDDDDDEIDTIESGDNCDEDEEDSDDEAKNEASNAVNAESMVRDENAAEQPSAEEIEMQHLEDVVLHDDDDDEDDADDDMDLDELQAVVAAREASQNELLSSQSQGTSGNVEVRTLERRRLYVQASMQVLSIQHRNTSLPKNWNYLEIQAEDALLESVCSTVKPPATPLNTKIVLRRAPSQEEFFLRSLSRNPVPINILQQADPTVGDLIKYIANDLQMGDSAELIEIIVANKILDVNLKLRVVHQVLWKNTLIENNGSPASSLLASAGGGLFSTGSALSIIWSSGAGATRLGAGNSSVTVDTPASALPPMMAMYRLAGVDGEATEDTIGVDDLVDPEALSDSMTSEEQETLLEAEFGLTRLVTEGRGATVLLRSIQNYISDKLRRIRRDDVGLTRGSGHRNPSWILFKQCPPCHGVLLLRHCCMLSSNRRILLQARAPSVLLTLLLDVLKVVEGSDEKSSTVSNPTAEILQELIEKLTSDISIVACGSNTGASGSCERDMEQDAASMPLLLQSIETISLSPPLRSIIAKLLPFLTYGLADMSRELARHFHTHIDAESLASMESSDETETKKFVLVNTFVQTAVSLPANEVCNSLRYELTNCGFVDRLAMFIVKDMPKRPAPWSPALWQKGELDDNRLAAGGVDKSLTVITLKQRNELEENWRAYYCCPGLRTAFKMLAGLCRRHPPTQARLSMFSEFLKSCHWLESTSDSTTAEVKTNGLGLLAETLLDEMMDQNDEVMKLVEAARKKTRLRKKELSQEQRSKALLAMGSFGASVAMSLDTSEALGQSQSRSGLASILAPVVGLFQSNPSNLSASSASLPKSRKGKSEKASEKPAWLAEAELMQDEVGLTCAVCQEGRTFQPSELLGLYCFVKKVAIPMEQGGSRACIDGTNLLKALPAEVPVSLLGTTAADDWFPAAKAAAANLSSDVSLSLTVGSSGGRRNSLFTTTVSAGNGIHLSCHRRARQADRSHPKAPKSEWEGAALRNSRVTCNVILPLVTCQSASVPLVSIDAALKDNMTAVANILGTTPKSTLWTVLHDVRLLLLRIAYGESISADCGGGSIASNCQLIFYQFLMADMHERDAQVDQPEHSTHARALSTGLLAACAIVTDKDSTANNGTLTRGIADAATMAAIASVIFHNTSADGLPPEEPMSRTEEVIKPHPKRQWVAGKDYFLQSLLICAGRRHSRGMEGSGCNTSRAAATRQRSSTFADWNDIEMEENPESVEASTSGRGNSFLASRKRGRSSKPTVEDFQNALRPLITFYAIIDQLSAEYTPSMNMHDVLVDESVQRMVTTINDCQRARNIHELLRKAKVTMDHNEIIELLQKGMVSL